MKTFIIAEAGVNHNGRPDLALQLVEAAFRAGADAVKFQTFSAEKLVRRGAAKAAYQEKATGAGDQLEMLRGLQLSDAAHRDVAHRCSELGIEFMSTPFDEEAADFLVALGMRRIKVPSGELTNYPFLEHLVGKRLPMIVSTGMATLAEVEDAVRVIRAAHATATLKEPLEPGLTLLHCTSNYPASCADVNLRAMGTLARVTGLPVGYSDHTLGVAVSTAAVALGAVVVEKHFTLDRNLPGPDHQASLLPEELAMLVRQVREVEVALGSDRKEPSAAELAVRAVARRSITSTRRIARGTVIAAADLTLLRPGTGLPPAELPRVIGRLACRDIESGQTLTREDID